MPQLTGRIHRVNGLKTRIETRPGVRSPPRVGESRYPARPMITIRAATAADQQALGRFGGALMRQHHAADPGRFIQVEHPETGYGHWLVSRLSHADDVVLVAERAGEVVGYVWADVEGVSWKDLRGPCGFVHDIYVDEAARGQGAGRGLLHAAVDWIRSKGRSQVVLWTKTGNDHAKSLFTALGFRPTMTEMTLDVGSGGAIGHE
jgi:GNAT superfamily N-acetyltransferase